MPEAQIITNHDVTRAEAIHEHGADELRRAHGAETPIEADAQYAIDAQIAQHGEFLAKTHQSRRRLQRREVLPWQWLEHDHGCGQAEHARARQHIAEHRLMTAMHAVERTDGRNTAAMTLTQIVQPAYQFQALAPGYRGQSGRL